MIAFRNTFAARLVSLAHNREGMGAMELALALPFLMLLTLGMIDASTLIATKIDYEQAAQRTTDFALAKRPTNSNNAYLVAEAVRASGLPTDRIKVELLLECDGVRQADFNTACAIGQNRARFVNVEIRNAVATQFDWSSLAGFLGHNPFTNSVTVTGDSLVRFQ